MVEQKDVVVVRCKSCNGYDIVKKTVEGLFFKGLLLCRSCYGELEKDDEGFKG